MSQFAFTVYFMPQVTRQGQNRRERGQCVCSGRAVEEPAASMCQRIKDIMSRGARAEARGLNGREGSGILGEGQPAPSNQRGVWGNAVSYFSGIWRGAPAACILEAQDGQSLNFSGGVKFTGGAWPA